MKDGFIKVAAASPVTCAGRVRENTAAVIKCVGEAFEKGVKILVLPELCLVGAFGGDIYRTDGIMEESARGINEIAAFTSEKDILAVVGAPLRVAGNLYSCMFFIHRGKVAGIIPKNNTAEAPFSAYPGAVVVNDEYGAPFGTGIVFKEKSLGLCVSGEVGTDFRFPRSEGGNLALAGVQIICNSSAIPVTAGSFDELRTEYSEYSKRLKAGFIAANGSETGSVDVSSGLNIVVENGTVLSETAFSGRNIALSEIDYKAIDADRVGTPYFHSSEIIAETVGIFFDRAVTELTRKFEADPYGPADGDWNKRSEEILSIQARGLAARMKTSKTENLVLGISGGLDSTLALIVSIRAIDSLGLPRKNIHAITMPCFGTTSRTKGNAEKLCEKAGVTLLCIDIKDAVTAHLKNIGHNGSADVSFENAQARERTQILFDYANMVGGLVVGTGDMSELALGWCTYNGDHMASYGVNGTLTKTVIRKVVACEAEKKKELKDVLSDILDTPVSPELLPSKNGRMTQSTEAILGPYELTDFFVYHFIRYGAGREKLLRIAALAFERYPKETLERSVDSFLRRFERSSFKRNCSPDNVKVMKYNLSEDCFRLPGDAKIID